MNKIPEDPEPEDTYGDDDSDGSDEDVHSDDWGDTENEDDED